MYIVKYYNQWDFRCASLPVNLIRQIRQVKLEILEIKRVLKLKYYHMHRCVLAAQIYTIHFQLFGRIHGNSVAVSYFIQC